jgi:hypothetical protein
MGVDAIWVVIVSKYLKAVARRILEYGTTLKTQPMTSIAKRKAKRDVLVIGSSEQVHVVDALAITGDEGRGSLRKASGSWQTSIDPKMSEWGNPLRMEYP